MYREYIKTDTPVTAMLYSLDASYQRTQLRYFYDRLMDSMVNLVVYV